MTSVSGPSSEAAVPPPTTHTTSNPNDLPRKKSVKNITQSSRDRIDSILEEARERRLAMGTGKDSENPSPSPAKRGDDSEPQSPGGGGGGRDTESSADEETNIMRRSATSMNYQGTSTAYSQRRSPKNQPSTQSIRKSGRIHNPNAEERPEEDVAGEHQGWWARLISDYGSIELENKGSVARDHLALERTFLAWLRTSLAFASIGIAITQLFRLNTSSARKDGSDPYLQLRQMGKPLGATFLGISIVMLFIGFHRYFESQHWIIRGKFPASRGSIALVAGITLALMITSLVVVVVVEPRAFEKR